MKRKEVLEMIEKELKAAERRAVKAHRAEKDWDYSDSMLSLERAYADGYLEALYFLTNRIEDSKKKKKKDKK